MDKIKFRKNFISVYGHAIWSLFLNYAGGIEYVNAESDQVEIQIRLFFNKIKSTSNFYRNTKNRVYTRFVLITIEMANNKNFFASQYSLYDSYRWHIEHIIPKSTKCNNSLGNLTLITANTNTDYEFSHEVFENKKSYIQVRECESNLYINEIFSSDSNDVLELIEKRDSLLKNEFNNLFISPKEFINFICDLDM